MRAEANLDIFTEQLAEHKFDRSPEVADRDALIHVKAFDLGEGRVVGGVSVVAPIAASDGNDARGWRLRFEHAHLDGSGVSAQQQLSVVGRGVGGGWSFQVKRVVL